MGGFPIYVPKINKKEVSFEKLIEKISSQQALIAAYCNISNNGYMPLVPDNNDLSIVVTNIDSLESALFLAFDEYMKLSKIYDAIHTPSSDHVKINVL